MSTATCITVVTTKAVCCLIQLSHAPILLAEADMALEGNAGPVLRLGAGLRLRGSGWGLARGAVKAAAATLSTVAIAALADKHTCHAAQQRHQIPSLPRFR